MKSKIPALIITLGLLGSASFSTADDKTKDLLSGILSSLGDKAKDSGMDVTKLPQQIQTMQANYAEQTKSLKALEKQVEILKKEMERLKSEVAALKSEEISLTPAPAAE